MIICEKCGKIMKPEKNGVCALEKTEQGVPYKIWMTDRMKCPCCGHLVLRTNIGQRPLSEHYQINFMEKLKGVEIEFV